jgi:hypothetical protein
VSKPPTKRQHTTADEKARKQAKYQAKLEVRRRRSEQLQAKLANQPVHPNAMYRTSLFGRMFFGLSGNGVRNAIKKGLIPAPVRLGDTDSSPTAWTGAQIIKHQQELEAKAAQQPVEA